MLTVTDNWKETHPGSAVGLLQLEQVANPKQHEGLDALKKEFEEQVRLEYAGHPRRDMEALPQMQPYVRYYRRFDKTYHVLLQLDSIVNKGKELPRVAALVEAMFLAELKNHLLTAGHDADLLQQPLRLDAAQGSEEYVKMNGKSQIMKAGDMYVADAEGVLSSILHGPDRRTAISSDTTNALFVVYAPPGISLPSLEEHLQEIENYARLISPQTRMAGRWIYQAESEQG